MKQKIISIFLFFVCMLACPCLNMVVWYRETCCAEQTPFCVVSGNSEYNLYLNSLRYKTESNLIEKLEYMGFSAEIICNYIFKDFNDFLDKLKADSEIDAVDSTITLKNKLALPTHEIDGKTIDKNRFLTELVNAVKSKTFKLAVPMVVVNASTTYQDNLKLCNLRSCFKTPIYGINQEGRINNIAVALSNFDGMIIKNGQTVSFNKVVGETTEEKGYKQAKIILNGKYVDDYGGGVCQAATTLYNALLLAGVEIKEANPHSLKVGYVEGAFDSMVATGVSDLVFTNTTNGDIILSTNCVSDCCEVSVFGLPSEYKIERRSEKVEFDVEKLPTVASRYRGFLDYYKDGQKVFEKNIRNNNYYKLKPSEV